MKIGKIPEHTQLQLIGNWQQFLPTILSFSRTIVTTIEISKLLSKATWNLECNFHMPIFIARIEREREREERDQTKCTTIHTGHTGLSMSVCAFLGLCHTQHDTQHSCCTKNMCNAIPKTAAHRQNKYKNQR